MQSIGLGLRMSCQERFRSDSKTVSRNRYSFRINGFMQRLILNNVA
ncbi:hypothetical protein BH10PSE18_BH10PSE18_23040 [soil metagenome]